jgi:hypothetical protein
MHTQFDIPTRPMIWIGPSCQGACQQGRADCPHHMVCGGQLTDAELDDALAEIGHDTQPATLDDARTAADGVLDGFRQLGAIAGRLVSAVWRAL